MSTTFSKDDLKDVVEGYLISQLQIQTDLNRQDRSLDYSYDVDDLSSEYQSSAAGEIEDFVAYCGEDVGQFMAAIKSGTEENKRKEFGRNFYLTREGHGAGFWDLGLPEELGARLTAAAKSYGSAALLYLDSKTEKLTD